MNWFIGLFVATVLLLAKETSAAGAGRAFPIHSENYIIENFQSINPGIEWDITNFLVDKSGWYANCNNIRRGYETTREVTPEGNSIGVLYDHINGEGVDTESVNLYLRSIIDKWMKSGEHYSTIRGADRFGCSVRPGCRSSDRRNVVVVACLFSPAGWGEYPEDKPEEINQRGRAFTPQQYDLAEEITGNIWDRSHFIENLSGYEVTCAMINAADWPFTKAITLAREYGVEVVGLKGVALNEGSTQKAMVQILQDFKAIQSASKVGCSLIPDCTSGRGDLSDEMWVVVTCMYEEE